MSETNASHNGHANQKDDPIRRILETYPLRFVQRIVYSDMDAFRHLNNGATGRYFEEGRADLNMRVFGADCMTDPPAGLQLLFANVVIDFLAQAYYPGDVEIGTGIIKLGNTSYIQAQAAFQNGHCFALSEAIMVKAIEGRPEKITASERKVFETLLLRR